MKSVSLPRRANSDNPAKATSDAIDLLALFESAAVVDVVADLVDAPTDLRRWIATTTSRVFVDDRRYTEARLRASRQAVHPGALRLAAQLAESLASDFRDD